ncbi:GNAT family N-acetyltransferase [Paenibacillus sp. SYP-B3998]|uniref:GNAT family N-acetyltransferase n=1 Tax=Paenibacillus sp. SYP-B3998 TaxID=2678564 RepID=A0A6G3ZW62_9BACL|nr:GNAT family N-acetyltransferase [Paenibacillus sp. SYP-B3998]NEW05811.1 GNAT family N-acetyltransferase [Paenibacillus sp. SYP-B3998]
MPEQMNAPHVKIEPWSNADLNLLRLINAPEMMEHLGGPETEEQILRRHKRYLEIAGRGTGRMFSIVLLPKMETVGSVGYWDSMWKEEFVNEIGWSILPPYQGKGIATAAVSEAIASASIEQKIRFIHAFPSINNLASNAVCRKLNFSLMSTCEFEYPPGNIMQCNDWRIEIDSAVNLSYI